LRFEGERLLVLAKPLLELACARLKLLHRDRPLHLLKVERQHEGLDAEREEEDRKAVRVRHTGVCELPVQPDDARLDKCYVLIEQARLRRDRRCVSHRRSALVREKKMRRREQIVWERVDDARERADVDHRGGSARDMRPSGRADDHAATPKHTRATRGRARCERGDETCRRAHDFAELDQMKRLIRLEEL
jgi:hypothetical protein